MGTFFFDPNVLLPRDPRPDPTFDPFAGSSKELDPRSRGPGGGGFGPIAGPVDIPPLFGPIAGPVNGGLMPGGFLPGLFGTQTTADARSRIIGDLIRIGRGFLPTQVPTVPVPDVQIGVSMERVGTAVATRGCGPCMIQRQLPARVVNVKGRAIMGADGTIRCVPAARRMNPMNGRAATRAARRLTSVMRFQKKIQKAVRRACGTRAGGGGRSAAARKKSSCR